MEMEIRKLNATLQKDYYDKAIVKCYENGNRILQSYNTEVCGIMSNEFVKLWNGYSTTTMKHINDFRIQNGLNTITKKEWDSIPCDNTDKFIVKFYNGLREWGGKTIFADWESANNFGEEVCERRSWNISYDIQQIA